MILANCACRGSHRFRLSWNFLPIRHENLTRRPPDEEQSATPAPCEINDMRGLAATARPLRRNLRRPVRLGNGQGPHFITNPPRRMNMKVWSKLAAAIFAAVLVVGASGCASDSSDRG